MSKSEKGARRRQAAAGAHRATDRRDLLPFGINKEIADDPRTSAESSAQLTDDYDSDHLVRLTNLALAPEDWVKEVLRETEDGITEYQKVVLLKRLGEKRK